MRKEEKEYRLGTFKRLKRTGYISHTVSGITGNKEKKFLR